MSRTYEMGKKHTRGVCVRRMGGNKWAGTHGREQMGGNKWAGTNGREKQ